LYAGNIHYGSLVVTGEESLHLSGGMTWRQRRTVPGGTALKESNQAAVKNSGNCYCVEFPMRLHFCWFKAGCDSSNQLYRMYFLNGWLFMSIIDVANKAGVSPSTVSRVMNGHPRVAQETARSVRKVMAELGYVPSDNRPGPKPLGRAAPTKPTVAFIIFGSSVHGNTPGFEQLVRGVSEAVNKSSMGLAIFHHQDIERPPERLLDTSVHGLLLHGAIPNPEVQAKLGKIPALWLMGNHQRPTWGDQVMPNHYEVGSLAAQHLHNHGHQHLAFLNMDAQHWPFRLYYQAFAAAAEQLGASVTRVDDIIKPSSDYWFKYDTPAIEGLVDRYLALSPRPTGLMIADDMQTAMIQPALQRKGVKIGSGEVEVVSVNNEQPYLIGLNPRPTVVDIRASAIGQRGVAQIRWRIKHPEVTDRILMLVQPELIEPPMR
jgi:DNA-binding LacI/PurR family transcriptional regulator